MRYVLDTSFAIDQLRGDPVAVGRFRELFAAGDDPYLNEVVVCELAAGSSAPHDPDLLALLGAVEFIQPGPDSALLAGRWRAEARRRGFTLSLPDALIAAAADSLGATVLTRNVRDFALTPVPVASY